MGYFLIFCHRASWTRGKRFCSTLGYARLFLEGRTSPNMIFESPTAFLQTEAAMELSINKDAQLCISLAVLSAGVNLRFF